MKKTIKKKKGKKKDKKKDKKKKDKKKKDKKKAKKGEDEAALCVLTCGQRGSQVDRRPGSQHAAAVSFSIRGNK